MGNNLLYNLTSDIDDDVKGMSPKVEKQVRLKVLADRIKNYHKTHNKTNGCVNSSATRTYSENRSRNYPVQTGPAQDYTPPNHTRNHNGRVPKPKKFLEIELPLSQEFLENCVIKQNVKFEAKFGNNICQVTGSIADICQKGVSLDKVMVNGPVESYNMDRQLHLLLAEQPKYAPAPAGA